MIELITIIVLLLLGLILIFAEVIFVPGTTLVGLAGVALSGIGIYLTFKSYGDVNGWIVLSSNALIILFSIYYGLKGNVWRRFSLNSTLQGSFNSETPVLLNVGDSGKTLSDLRPSGKADFGGQIIEVKTFGSFVKAGSIVKVIRIEANNFFVENITQ